MPVDSFQETSRNPNSVRLCLFAFRQPTVFAPIIARRPRVHYPGALYHVGPLTDLIELAYGQYRPHPVTISRVCYFAQFPKTTNPRIAHLFLSPRFPAIFRPLWLKSIS